MTRIAIGGFQHETNTFAPFPTTLDLFEQQGAWPGLVEGADLLETMDGLNLPTSGFMSASSHELVPLLWCYAEPGGYVAKEAFDTITGRLVDGICATKPDAVFLELHGAMVTEAYPDAEAEILRRVRDAVGPDMPIAVALDLHGNMSRAFFDLATVVTIYRTYPHTDLAETGARAARLLDAALNKPLAKAYRQGNFMMPITAQSTEFEPAKSLYAALDHVGAVSADLAIGFPPADIPDCGPSIFAYGETQAQADAAADAVLDKLNAAKPDFDPRLLPAAEAIAKAFTLPAPVVIADPQDNPGAGGTGDTTGLLQALIDADAQDAVLGMMYEPKAAEAAHAAGLAAEITIPLGGGFSEFSSPIETTYVVEALSDGNFTATGPMYKGAKVALGLMARLRVKGTGVQVVVGSKRAQNADQEIFRAVGIEPKDHAILCVKSAIHFMADYKRISDHILYGLAPGANPCDLKSLPFTRLRGGVELL